MSRRLLLSAFLVSLSASLALAQAGVQITRDGKRTLISKDVGAERWAITLNENGSVTGNVFQSGGGDPAFIYCVQRSRVDDDITLECSGADRCAAAPCPATDWTFIANVTLPVSFFEPPVAAAQAIASSVLARTSGSGNRPSGVQVTPDQTRTLINKDVGAERWAITRHNDDRTVTGNVFTGSAPPQFVWCEETGQVGSDVSLACYGADRCVAAPCTPDAWIFLTEVTLPLSFFSPPTGNPTPTPSSSGIPAPTPTPGGGRCGNNAIDEGEECDGSDLGGNDCENAYGGSEGCTGTLRCGSDCRFDGSACTCPCIDDTDCFFPGSPGLPDLLEMDCTGFFCSADDSACNERYACVLGGVCQNSVCRTSTVPTLEICTGLEDPKDPEFPRCLYCEDFDCSNR